MKPTFKALIKIAGKILFVIGLVLTILMICFGFWPSFVFLLIMLAGAGMIWLNRDVDTTMPFSFSSITSVNPKSVQTFLITAIVTVSCLFILAAALLIFSQNYLKKRDTISDCKDITAALEAYKESKKAYPSDLVTLVSNDPVHSNWKKDSWGNLYKYRTGAGGTTFVLTSAGKDGKFDTDDDIIFRH